MHDRGCIKWAPFNSIISGTYLTNEILKEKSKRPKPILSDEQIKNIENCILESYANKEEIKLVIYQQGFFYNLGGKITKIDPIKKIIVLNKNKNIYFCEIIKAFI